MPVHRAVLQYAGAHLCRGLKARTRPQTVKKFQVDLNLAGGGGILEDGGCWQSEFAYQTYPDNDLIGCTVRCTAQTQVLVSAIN